MKIASIIMLVALFVANIVHAQKPGAAVPKGKSMSKAELTALVSDTHLDLV